jgi:hypothetical protein
MGDEKKRSPENRRANGEMILKMAGGCSIFAFGLVAFVKARPTETFVGVLIVLGEIETVLDQGSTGKSVIADAIAAHPGIQKGKRAQKEKKQPALRFGRAARGGCAEVWSIRQRGTRRNFSYPRSPKITLQHHAADPNSRDRGRDLVTPNMSGDIVAHDFTSESDIHRAGCRLGGGNYAGGRIVFRNSA